jgi:hypothetical protein
MDFVTQWCVESILYFCDTCRREGRVWAADGYGFSATKSIEYNVEQHKNIINRARYIHYFSGKKVSPVHFSHARYANLCLIGTPNTLRKPRDPENLSRTVLLGRGFACKTNACSPPALYQIGFDKPR